MIIIPIILIIVVQSVEAKLYWTIKTTPIVYGSDVVLFCNTTLAERDCFLCLTSWYGGSENSIIAMSEFTVNSDKYNVFKESQGFSLIIHNFQLVDGNKDYECSHGFHSYKKTLIINEPHHTSNQLKTALPLYTNEPKDSHVNEANGVVDIEIIDAQSSNVHSTGNQIATSFPLYPKGPKDKHANGVIDIEMIDAQSSNGIIRSSSYLFLSLSVILTIAMRWIRDTPAVL